jgi:hypothetical protein
MFGLYILEHNSPDNRACPVECVAYSTGVNPVKTDSPRSLPAPWNDFALLFHWGDSVRDKRNWSHARSPKLARATEKEEGVFCFITKRFSFSAFSVTL